MKKYRLIIIGAGPAGLSAALGATGADGANGVDGILLIDRNPEPGGLLRQCIHTGFGQRLFGEDLAGPEFSERLVMLAKEAGIDILTNTSVINISADRKVTIAGENGVGELGAGALILASGCRERSIGSLPVYGTRPAGVFPAGSAQKMINICGYSVGERVVLLGSGDVGLIAARRLALEGKKVLMAVEKEKTCGGLMHNKLFCLDAFGIPLITQSTVSRLYGRERLTGVRICPVDESGGIDETKGYDLECDTLVTSLGLIPETDLLWPLDRANLPWLFVCGNARKVQRFADDVVADGKLAGKSAAEYLQSGRREEKALRLGAFPEEDGRIVCLFCRENCILKIENGAVRGGKCRKKEMYASPDPKSLKGCLTTTVGARGGKRLPVRTREPVAIEDHKSIMPVLKNTVVSEDVSLGQTIVRDICGTGADITATMTLGRP